MQGPPCMGLSSRRCHEHESERKRRQAVRSLLRAASLSAARRQPRGLSQPLAGPAAAPRGLSSLLARAALPGRSIDPDRRLRDVAGGQTRPALARGARDRHRLQRDQRPPHRGAQAEIRPRQSRGPPAPRRARRRARDRRFDQIVCTGVLHHLAGSRRRARGAARRAAARTARCTSWCTRRTDGPASTCCRSSAGGSASPPPTTGSATSSPRSARCRPAIRWRRCCARRRTSGRRRRSPMRCCTRRTAPIRCRSYSSCSRGQGCSSAAGSGRRPTRRTAASWRASRRPRGWRQLPSPEQYAAVELFRGTMLRHSVVVYRDDGAPAPRAAGQLRRRRLARLRADSHAGHDLRRGAAAAGRGRRADQPDPRLHRHLPADRRAREAAVRRDRRHAHDRRDRAGPGSQGRSRPRARSSSGSTGTIRSPSTRPAESVGHVRRPPDMIAASENR